jgi:hypothetical protein
MIGGIPKRSWRTYGSLENSHLAQIEGDLKGHGTRRRYINGGGTATMNGRPIPWVSHSSKERAISLDDLENGVKIQLTQTEAI